MSDTPETTAAVIYRGRYVKIGDKWDSGQCGVITEPGEEYDLIPGAEWDDVVLLPADFACRLERERNELRRWKTEALTVMPPYQEIGREIGATLGDSTHDKILPELIRRREEIERLRKQVSLLAGDLGAE